MSLAVVAIVALTAVGAAVKHNKPVGPHVEAAAALGEQPQRLDVEVAFFERGRLVGRRAAGATCK
jgi:hypothetical protein